MTKNILAKSLLTISLLAIGTTAVYAWTGATGNPPTSNAYEPINISSTAQTKVGGFTSGGQLRGATGWFTGLLTGLDGTFTNLLTTTKFRVIGSGGTNPYPVVGDVLTATDTSGNVKWKKPLTYQSTGGNGRVPMWMGGVGAGSQPNLTDSSLYEDTIQQAVYNLASSGFRTLGDVCTYQSDGATINKCLNSISGGGSGSTYTAGTGLSLAGGAFSVNSGSISTCNSATSKLLWNNGFTCGTDQTSTGGTGGGGTVTSVTAGAGLTGGPIITSGTISADFSVVQKKVSGSCTTGIASFDANGVSVCSPAQTITSYNNLPAGALAGWCAERFASPYLPPDTSFTAPAIRSGQYGCSCSSGFTSKQTGSIYGGYDNLNSVDIYLKTFICIKN